jgi:hypothetical protein
MDMADVIDLTKLREEAERRLREDPVIQRLNRIHKIVSWSSEMHKRGLMPADVARAFYEYFSGENEQ